MKLEDFIRQHRNEFDDKEPPAEVWSTVEASLPIKKKPSLWNSLVLWRAAAIILMVVTVGLLVIPRGSNGRSGKTDPSLNDFKDVEAYYIEQISTKEKLIDQFQRSEGMNGFTQDFHQLEAMYMVLKEEMKVHPGKKVKDALVLNLLIRIDLLNQQLHKLEKETNSTKLPAEKEV